MDILVLVAQRKCRYPGEYAPEVLEAIDAIGNCDNPDFLEEAEAKARASNEFDAVAVVRVRVPSESIAKALLPATGAIAGEVIQPKATTP